MNHPALPETERELGKYHIVRPLKVGGTAAIYLAVLRGENNFSREVVIKRPLPHLVADNRARLMFVDEAHIASRLSHPNICQVLDLVAREDELYLVLEYLKGVDLREVLKRAMELGRLIPPEVCVWIGIETCAGLDFAHEALAIDGSALNIIHRDVSPKNIRITHSGSVKVIDFGIARAESRATETAVGTIKGTLGYMSPEQIMGDEIDRRSDVFAFGICLFQMLTCRNPFDGATLKERVRRLTQAPVPSIREFNGALDPEIESIVDKCLKRDVEERYQRMRDVQIDLDRYLAKLQSSSPRQKLISFLEEIFPGVHDTDHELKIALTEISSVSGRIDTSQRLMFPDDEGPRYASVHTRSTMKQDGTVSTVKDAAFQNTKTSPLVSGSATSASASSMAGVGASETAKLPPLETEEQPKPERRAAIDQDSAVSAVDTTLSKAPGGWRGIAIALALVAGMAAGLAYYAIDRANRMPIDEASTGNAIENNAIAKEHPEYTDIEHRTPEHPQVAAGMDAGTQQVAEHTIEPVNLNDPLHTKDPSTKDPSTKDPSTKDPSTKDPSTKDPSTKDPSTKDRHPASRDPEPDRARLYFKTAVRLEREGKTDDALLMYRLAYDKSGRHVDGAIYKNLGILYNKQSDVAKARACFRGYLDKSEGAPDADRIRTMIASYPPTKSVACVEGSEVSAARKFADRRGAMIESWVTTTVEERLRAQ